MTEECKKHSEESPLRSEDLEKLNWLNSQVDRYLEVLTAHLFDNAPTGEERSDMEFTWQNMLARIKFHESSGDDYYRERVKEIHGDFAAGIKNAVALSKMIRR